MMRKQHRQEIRVFHKTEAIYNVLVQQVVKEIDPMYLKALGNPVTQAFVIPLNEILQHLMAVYGNLNPRLFMTKTHP